MPDHHFTRNTLFVDRSAPSQLSPRLFLSGEYFATQYEAVRQAGITAVVNLTPDDDGCADAGFKSYQVPIDDAEPLDPVHVQGFLTQMDAWEATEEVVLIHCHAGISRTSAFAIAWLMHKSGCTSRSDLRVCWSMAEDLVGRVRPIIMPHYLLKRAVLEHFAGVP